MGFHIPENNKGMTEEREMKFGQSVVSAFADAVKKGMYKDKVRFVSQPFAEAYEKGKGKLVNVFDKEPIGETGTLVFQKGSWTQTFFYYIKTGTIDGVWQMRWSLMLFTKHSQAETIGLDVLVFDNGGDTTKTFLYKEMEDNGCTADFWMAWLISMICFIKYCPIETKIIEGGRRGHHAGQKYVNETDQKIEILDSTWFTTIIRSEGFQVGGHFRMQPFGPGLAQKKLIWIDPFEKHGYTRKAKIS